MLSSKMSAIVGLVAFAYIVVPLGVRAQDQIRRVSLDEALQMFGENNLELRLARAQMAEVAGLARQARAIPNPLISVTYESLGQGGTSYSETYVNASQRVDWLWQGGPRRRSAAVTVDAVTADLRADSVRLAFEVKRAYVRGAVVEEQRDVIREVTAVFRQAESRGASRFAQGDISGYDLRRLRVERARYENLLGIAEVDLQATRRRLATLIAPESDDLAIAPLGAPEGEPPAVERVDLGPGRSEIDAALARVDVAQANARLDRAGLFPEAAVTGGYKRQSDGFAGVFIGLDVPIPTFDRRGGAIAAADARVQDAESRLALTRRLVENDVKLTFETFASLARRVDLLRGDGFEGIADLLDIAQVSYSEGEMSLIGLLDAADAFREARVTATDLRAAYWVSYYDLERALGGRPAAEAIR